jgi:hypothetical protein
MPPCPGLMRDPADLLDRQHGAFAAALMRGISATRSFLRAWTNNPHSATYPISPPLRGRVPNVERVDLEMALRARWRSSSGSGLPTRSVRKPSLWSSEVDFIWTAARSSLSGSVFAIAA